MSKKTYDPKGVVVSILGQELKGATLDGEFLDIPPGIKAKKPAQVRDSKTQENLDELLKRTQEARLNYLKQLGDALWSDTVELFCQGYMICELRVVTIASPGGSTLGYQLWVHHELYREYGVSLHA